MKKYWYFLLIAILLSASSDSIDKAMKRLIPDDRKRAKFYQGFLFAMTIFYGIWIWFITKDTFPLPLCLFLSGFPLVCAIIGTLISWHRHKKNK